MDHAATERVQALLDDVLALLEAHDRDAVANYKRDAGMRSKHPGGRAYAKWKQEIVKTVDQHRPGGVRFQAQTPLVGRSLLTVLSSARFDAVIQRAVHPDHGVLAWRVPRASPLVLPVQLQGPAGERRLNALMAFIYAYHQAVDPASVAVPAVLDSCSAGVCELAEWAHFHWAQLALPDDAVFDCEQYEDIRQCVCERMPGAYNLPKVARLSDFDLRHVLQNDFIAYAYEYRDWQARAIPGEPMPALSDRLLAHSINPSNPGSEIITEAASLARAIAADPSMPQRCWLLRMIQPDARPGDVLIWTSFHGSAAVLKALENTPHLVMFLDMMLRETLSSDARLGLYTVQCQRPVEFGGGSKACRSEGWNCQYNLARRTGGGLAKLNAIDRTPLARYLCGLDAAEAQVHAAQNFLPPLTVQQMHSLQDNGWLVVPAALMDLHSNNEWSRLCTETIDQFEDYLNWALLEEQDTEAEPLRFSAPHDRRWAALSGRSEEAERHFGHRLWLRVTLIGGAKCGTAQAGGTRIAGDSGMGPATNAYDLPAQQRLRYSPALYSLFAQLYGRYDLMAVPERFRLKVASKVFATHSDRLVPLP